MIRYIYTGWINTLSSVWFIYWWSYNVNMWHGHPLIWPRLPCSRKCNLLANCSMTGPLARYVKLWVAHAPGMPGTPSAPPRASDLDMHQGTCVTHVPWCMSGSLTSGFLLNRWRGNVPNIPSTCANRNFTYLVRDPWPKTRHLPRVCLIFISTRSCEFYIFTKPFGICECSFRQPTPILCTCEALVLSSRH